MFKRLKKRIKDAGINIVLSGLNRYFSSLPNPSNSKPEHFAKLYHQVKSSLAPRHINLDYMYFNELEKKSSDAFYRAAKACDRQSLIFYMDCIPLFWEFFQISKLDKYCEYSMLDVGGRSGAGTNLFGELFCDIFWGYEVKIIVDPESVIEKQKEARIV